MSDTPKLCMQGQAEPLTPEQQEIRRLRHEVEMLTDAGVIECAVRNKSVAEYMQHWEKRAEKAEAEAQRLRSCITRYGDAGALAALTDANKRAEKAEAEVERLQKLFTWAANELLACDYGDNDRYSDCWKAANRLARLRLAAQEQQLQNLRRDNRSRYSKSDRRRRHRQSAEAK